MTSRDNLPRSLRAFEVDAVWYQSYWYQPPRPSTEQSVRLPLRFMVWASVVCVAAYFAY